MERSQLENNTLFPSYNEVREAAKVGKDSRIKILVVDDTWVNTEVVYRIIRKTIQESLVDTVFSGEEAVMRCREMVYDVIFMDIMLAYMDGVETARTILAEHPEFHPGKAKPMIVASTSALGDDVRKRCLAVGMVDFLEKPVRLSAVADIVRSVAINSHVLHPTLDPKVEKSS